MSAPTLSAHYLIKYEMHLKLIIWRAGFWCTNLHLSRYVYIQTQHKIAPGMVGYTRFNV
jgi:hypothetical protein